MSLRPAEEEVLRGLVPELEAEGYEVFIEPRPPLAPAFLKGLRPDAIALREGKKLLIQFARESPPGAGALERMQRLVAAQPGWELRAILVPPATLPVSLASQSKEQIAASVSKIERLLDHKFVSAALLQSWACLEAMARLLLTEQFRKPQTPGRLVETLAELGYLTPPEADRLRILAKSRNSFIHGELDTVIAEDDVRFFIAVLNTLIGMIGAASGAAN
jgi:uncharacterized protein YutE (UPF0331/DUF86 family)